MKFAAGVEYDGSHFCGWQSQIGVRTVQDCVERALSEVADQAIRVVTAGRTDTGVHACAQVIHFVSDLDRGEFGWRRGVTSNLPDDVAFLWVQPVVDDFHARFCATERRYRYIILNRPTRPTYLSRRVTWEYRPLDEGRMQEAARCLLGTHDFSAYRAKGCQAKSPVRELRRLEVRRRGDLLCIEVDANAFLQHMVRNIAGVLMTIGAGEREPVWADEILQTRQRQLGGVTAPPDGLYLMSVVYPSQYGLPQQSTHCGPW
ncbi:MAG: tRNA pseudouridine(38-40) synthase TruA [Gammaproteobacteria bacterium]|nr:tRNA pseudouridine(38-40) synthase TruA [Gammaproteobacteria bacterium]